MRITADGHERRRDRGFIIPCMQCNAMIPGPWISTLASKGDRFGSGTTGAEPKQSLSLSRLASIAFGSLFVLLRPVFSLLQSLSLIVITTKRARPLQPAPVCVCSTTRTPPHVVVSSRSPRSNQERRVITPQSVTRSVTLRMICKAIDFFFVYKLAY